MKKVLQKYWAWAFVVIPLLLQAIFFYVPMFQGAFYSFTNWTGLTYNYKFVGLNNFKLLFMDPKFMNAIGFTAIITIAMVVGEIALGIFVPFQVIMIPITVMMSKLGLANTFGLILLYLTYAIPQTLFLYVGYIKISIPESLDEAAEIDGANQFTTYFRIIFPMMKPMHATTMIINALWFWNDFMLPLLVLNRDSKMWTLPLFQYNYAGQYFNDYGPSFASYVVGIISITIVYLFFQRHIISGMSNGAVK
ncbi:sugar ABC transporter permease [Streptococcus pneumoniae]|nr:sugar ABC transporter permease [Streptococcus pneumoniae]